MSWLRDHPRSAWICGLTLLVPALLYLRLLFGLWDVRSEYAADIAALEPRIARLAGLVQHEDQLRDSYTRLDNQMSRLVYPAGSDPAALSTALQQDARGLFTGAGMSVSNSQVLPARDEGDFDYLAVKLTVTGSLDELDDALADVADHSPLLLVESITLAPTRSRTVGSQTLTVTVQLMSLREAS